MNKKFFSALLMGSLLLGGTFVSCKDYDDDIENLQTQIDKSADQLNQKVSELQSSISAAQSTAEAKASAAQTVADAAKGAANDAAAAAKAAQAAADKVAADLDAANKDLAGKIEAAQNASNQSAEDIAALQAAVEANTAAIQAAAQVAKAAQEAADAKASSEDVAAAAQKAADDLKAAKEELEGKLSELEAELNAVKESLKNTTTSDSLEAANEAIKKIEESLNSIMNVVGKRLTSLVFAPKTYINGIEAIKFVNLKYSDWTNEPANWQADNAPAKAKDGKVEDYGTVAEYLVSPAGVTLAGIKELKFRTQYDVSNTRAAKTLELNIVNSKIEDGVLVLDLKKNDFPLSSGTETGANVTMNDTVLAGTTPDTVSVVSGVTLKNETMTIVALEAVLNDAVKTEAEKDQEISVFSDWARVEEGPEIPRIRYANAKACGTLGDKTDNSHFWAFSKIYTDSKKKTQAVYTVNKDDVKNYSITQKYNEPLDLMSIVTVCTDKGTLIKNYAKYGLDFEFHLLDYQVKNQGTTEDATNQKLFAKLEGSTLTATSETGLENNRNAVGRTPVVQIVLKDTKANAVIDVRYVKILWVTDAPSVLAWPENMNAVLGYECSDKYDSIWVGETYLNKLYAEIVTGGMDKAQFYAKYTTLSPVYALDQEITDEYMQDVVNGNVKLDSIGEAKWKVDNGGSDKTQNIVVNFSDINPHIWENKVDKGVAPEADFEQDGFFMFISADGLSRIFVPVKIYVKAGVYYTQYAQEQWNTGANTVTGLNSPAADKLRTINPILYSDTQYGNSVPSGNPHEATQMLGSITMGYRYEGKAPQTTADLVRYQYAQGTLQANLVAKNKMSNPSAFSNIHFDKTRLGSLPTLTKNDSIVGAVVSGTTKNDREDFTWFVYSSADSTKEVLAYGIPNYNTTTKTWTNPIVKKGSVGAVIENDSIYLVDSLAVSTFGKKSLPTEAALLLVGQSVPVVVNAEHCDEVEFDKYYFNFVKPLKFAETGKTITLKDVTNEGDSVVVDLEDYVQLKENFGQNASRIYLFTIPSTKNDTIKNNTLKNWYDVKVAPGESDWFSTAKALTSLRLDGKQDATCETPLKDILGKDGNTKAYDITIGKKTVLVGGTQKVDSLGNKLWNSDGTPQMINQTEKVRNIVKFHNTNGNGLAPGESFKIDIPVTVDTKWQKPLVGYIHVVIKNGYDQ